MIPARNFSIGENIDLDLSSAHDRISLFQYFYSFHLLIDQQLVYFHFGDKFQFRLVLISVQSRDSKFEQLLEHHLPMDNVLVLHQMLDDSKNWVKWSQKGHFYL